MSLHKLLRTRTRTWHDKVEEAFDAFDLHSEDGARAAILAHFTVMEAALPALSEQPGYRDEIARLRDLAKAATPASAHGMVARSLDHPIHPLAVAYVIIGSRLGSRIITRTLKDSGTVLSAEVLAFLGDEGSGACWRQLRQDLDAINSQQVQTDICLDAERMFAFYHQTAVSLRDQGLESFAR